MPQTGNSTAEEFSAIVLQTWTTESWVLVMILKVTGLLKTLGEQAGEIVVILLLRLEILAVLPMLLHTPLFERTRKLIKTKI